MSLLNAIKKIVSKTDTADKNSPTPVDEPTTQPSSELTYNQDYNSFIKIRGSAEYQYFATIGSYRITPTFKTPQLVQKCLQEQSLELIGIIVHVMIEINKDWKESTETITPQN